MILRSGQDRLEIALVEWAGGTTPAGSRWPLRLNVAVETVGCRGGDAVWVEADEWTGFLQALRELERTRRGAAELRSVVPEECVIRFRILDSAGHVGVEGHLVRRSAPTHGPRSARFEFALAMDAGDLATCLREFEGYAETAPRS
jgi:hypothetical protein